MSRRTRLIMGMPITVDIPGAPDEALFAAVFSHFVAVDLRFSPFRDDSELVRYDTGEIAAGALSPEMAEVMDLAATTTRETHGAFDIRRPDGRLDPSGIVKGWAIRDAARKLAALGASDFCIEAGGDIQTAGLASGGQPWRVGIRNPFAPAEVVKVLGLSGEAVATSGSYIRGGHIYDPHRPDGRRPGGPVSLSVVADDILEADRYATAAFAMGREGICLIEETGGIEGYAIDPDGTATLTSGFRSYECRF